MKEKISLKAARVNAGLTQNEAAKKIGVTRDTLRNWETGKSSPSVVVFKTIESVYGMSYDDISFLPQDTRNA